MEKKFIHNIEHEVYSRVTIGDPCIQVEVIYFG